MIMKFIVNQAVFTEKQKGNQFFTMDMCIYMYIYIKQSNESEISPIKPTGVTRIQAWIRRVFRNNDYVQVKSSKSRADGKNTN